MCSVYSGDRERPSREGGEAGHRGQGRCYGRNGGGEQDKSKEGELYTLGLTEVFFSMQLETGRMGSEDGGGSGGGQREWTRWREWACHELAEVRILYCQRYRVEW